MGKKAFIFPGQGSQYVGMAKDLFDKSDVIKTMVKEGEDAIGIKLSDIMFNGPMESLKQTDNTQPAIFLHSVLLASLIKSVKPDMVAGHSLGEYSAHVSAGSISFVDALKLVRERGEAMLQAGIEQPGTMAAVVGMDSAKLDRLCKEVTTKAGVVQCANFNSPGQVVISGSAEGVKEAMKAAKENGAKLVKELPVSGAFHSPLMESASERLKNKLDSTTINNASIPVYANVTAKPVLAKDDIKKLLFDQLNAPVRWEETIVNMIADGADEFYEVGPGKVLQGLVKRINTDVQIFGIDTYAELERYL